MNIVAVDPGKTCGWAQYNSPLDIFRSGEFDPLQMVLRIEDLLPGIDLVVCESFVPRPGIRTWQPEALETIGALRYICARSRTPFELQAPADAKRFSTNGKLQFLGWRNSSPGGHADDAARHLLLAAVQHGVVDPAQFI